ncbi:MAG: hypothetical protein JOY90_04990 [Bradyrhizobium sp.]|nr:hypothetical protein [Bradyrhizobium sp.]
MNDKHVRHQGYVSRGPHPSWNIDRRALPASPDSAVGKACQLAPRRMTPAEIWAIVDEAN